MESLLASFGLIVCLYALPARAALGGDVASIDADQAQMKGSVELQFLGGRTELSIVGCR